MSEPGQQRQMQRYHDSLAAWLDLLGGFRCGFCRGTDWSLMSYQEHIPSWIIGPTGDDLRMGGFMAGWVACRTCQQLALYNLTAIDAGTPLADT